jgi:hypothetical protein
MHYISSLLRVHDGSLVVEAPPQITAIGPMPAELRVQVPHATAPGISAQGISINAAPSRPRPKPDIRDAFHIVARPAFGFDWELQFLAVPQNLSQSRQLQFKHG